MTYTDRFSGLVAKILFVLVCLPSTQICAQAADGSTVFNYGLILLAGILVVLVVMTVADNIMQIETKKSGRNASKSSFAIFPNINEIFGEKLPIYIDGDSIFRLKKGFDIQLEGEAAETISDIHTSRYAAMPVNYRGIAPIPKVVVEKGQEVLAGEVLFYDKTRPEIKFVAPVSGEIVEINRAAKRAISEIVILADKEIRYQDIPVVDLAKSSREDLVSHLKKFGAWTLFNQRPYDLLADDITPTNIFVSAFDSSPLAPDYRLLIDACEDSFQKGLDVLILLTDGEVHLGLDGRSGHKPQDAFLNAQGVSKHWFSGPHPSGNVGVQMHHIDPIKQGQKVWTITVQDVITLGGIFLHQRYDTRRIIAVTGAACDHPHYVRTYAGAQIGELITKTGMHDNSRIISGNVLIGKTKQKEEFLNFRDSQITILNEGNDYKMLGWIQPSSSSPSISKTFPATSLFKNLKYKGDTNTHGEERGYVVTGQYEQVLPMDIYPQHLVKSIMANDYDKMEGLGIYELSEEDVALCEYVCTSKVPVQKVLREGLEMMRDQE